MPESPLPRPLPTSPRPSSESGNPETGLVRLRLTVVGGGPLLSLRGSLATPQSTHSCHCEPQSGVAIQSGSWCGMPRRYVGCPTRPAGLPRRDFVLPRNDIRVGKQWASWFVPVFGCISPYAVIASPLGRGKPVWIVVRDARAIFWLPTRPAGLPCRCAPRNDKGGEVLGGVVRLTV